MYLLLRAPEAVQNTLSDWSNREASHPDSAPYKRKSPRKPAVRDSIKVIRLSVRGIAKCVPAFRRFATMLRMSKFVPDKFVEPRGFSSRLSSV